MELLLNLVWVLLTALLVGLWMRYAHRAGADRRMQLVALTVLILILFPVISVTDDLQAAQNPAETDCCLRRDHGCVAPHSIFPAVADLQQPAFAEVAFPTLGFIAPNGPLSPLMDNPALAPIQNRPPPSA
jgi:hypothetical protein